MASASLHVEAEAAAPKESVYRDIGEEDHMPDIIESLCVNCEEQVC